MDLLLWNATLLALVVLAFILVLEDDVQVFELAVEEGSWRDDLGDALLTRDLIAENGLGNVVYQDVEKCVDAFVLKTEQFEFFLNF